MPKKTKKHSRKISTILYVTLAILAWSAVWLSTQALFMTDVPILTNFLSASNVVTGFGTYSLWIMLIAVVVTLLWAWWSKNDFSFLKAKKWKWIILGYIPVLAAALVIMISREPFTVPGWLWAPCLLATTFFQSILTFGFLQTTLEKRLKPMWAAWLTALVFFAGHFWLVGNLPTLANASLYLIAFPIFALLRYKTKTIYATNIIHSAFHMFSVFF